MALDRYSIYTYYVNEWMNETKLEWFPVNCLPFSHRFHPSTNWGSKSNYLGDLWCIIGQYDVGVQLKDFLFWEMTAAAAAKSLQSCQTLCDPIDGSPPGSPVPGILQARTLEWVAISFSNVWKWKVKVKLLSHVWLFATPWTEILLYPYN